MAEHVHHHASDPATSMTGTPMPPDMHHMSNYFHFSKMETILFKWWMPDSPFGIIGSCAVLVILCFIMEAIRWGRVYWRKRVAEAQSEQLAVEGRRKLSADVIGDGCLQAIQLTISYSLMLVFMTFNVWLCAAVVLGEVVAHIVFRCFFPHLERPFESPVNVENCCG